MKPTDTSTHPAGRRIAGRAQKDDIIDPYKKVAKLHEPTFCPQCGAVYHEGAGNGLRGRRKQKKSCARPATASTTISRRGW
jgi:hypothetical protein